MQYCCSNETIARFFYNISSSCTIFFFFFYFTSIFLSKFLFFIGGNLFFPRNQDEYEFGEFSDEEEENEQYHAESMHKDKKSIFSRTKNTEDREDDDDDYQVESELDEEREESNDSERLSIYSSPALDSINSSDDEEENFEEEILTRDDDDPTSRIIRTIRNENKSGLIIEDNENTNGKCEDRGRREEKKEAIFTREENYLVFAPSKIENKKIHQGKELEEDIFGDSCTVGSTSKSSSEWRSSINYRDSGTDDPFSSSSRRSCPKWESYSVFQKYDEEMLFLDRISVQKLHETESLRSIQSCPRSISDRIVYKLTSTTRNKNSSDFRQNPYHELEGAYVAQICLTWEVLNWNYKYFQRLRAARRGHQDPGCPAYVAQQFQQFLVLLQRYVENEPYEHGRRPQIYARMRSLAPKLLQVPEYRDSEDPAEKKDERISSRISSDSFVSIIEEAITTFMDFLKADKENRCQIIAAFFRRRNRRASVDPTLLLLLKKVNKKKKIKLKDLRRSGSCLRKRKLTGEQEMEILMALIDLKVVSRVLRMKELNDEQLHWCEDKMSKIKVSSDGKLQRDSSPLFFPAH